MGLGWVWVILCVGNNFLGFFIKVREKIMKKDYG